MTLIRVGQAYKFNAVNARGWYILVDIRKNNSGQVELICKGHEPHTRIFLKDQITHSKEPKTVIIENLESVGFISGHEVMRGDLVYWPKTRAGRKPRSIPTSLAENSYEVTF